MTKVLVTGATGLLGSFLTPYLNRFKHKVISMGFSQRNSINVDLTIQEDASRALESIRPEVIINLVALTNVDQCELEPQKAYLLNVKTVENISYWMKSTNNPCHLIHISSDQIYDGLGPHSEDQITIRNQYAMSKYAGELSALTVSSTILRTNFIGESKNRGRTSFTDWLYQSLQNSRNIDVFTDVLFSPISIASLIGHIEKCITAQPNGIYNLGSRNGMSKADFAFFFAKELGVSAANLNPCKLVSRKSMLAKRPSDMRMNSSLFENHFRIQLPSLAEEIRAVAKTYLHNRSY